MTSKRPIVAAMIAVAAIAGSATFLATRPVKVRVLPESLSASNKITKIEQVLHHYADPAKSGTPPVIDCDGGQAALRMISDVYVTASAPTTFTFGFTFSQTGIGDAKNWRQITRVVSVPAGVTKISGVDQEMQIAGVRFPAHDYYFTANVFGGPSNTCEVVWPG